MIQELLGTLTETRENKLVRLLRWRWSGRGSRSLKTGVLIATRNLRKDRKSTATRENKLWRSRNRCSSTAGARPFTPRERKSTNRQFRRTVPAQPSAGWWRGARCVELLSRTVMATMSPSDDLRIARSELNWYYLFFHCNIIKRFLMFWGIQLASYFPPLSKRYYLAHPPVLFVSLKTWI